VAQKEQWACFPAGPLERLIGGRSGGGSRGEVRCRTFAKKGESNLEGLHIRGKPLLVTGYDSKTGQKVALSFAQRERATFPEAERPTLRREVRFQIPHRSTVRTR
jgi:hypothetical protein